MTTVHTLFGTWEIVTCTWIDGKIEISGLEGIKFRLDDSFDITWYNDLVSPISESKDCDSANVLFSCETFDVNEHNPRLTFAAFAGHSIEFNTNTLTPTESIILSCENWYKLECRRVKENEAAGQEKQFTLYDALSYSYFWDVNIKSSCGQEFHVHSSILRLNGFDCSMYTHPDVMLSAIPSLPLTKSTCSKAPVQEINTAVKIDITPMLSSEAQIETVSTCREVSSGFLQPPTESYTREIDGGNSKRLVFQRNHQLSSSYNCLSTKMERNDRQPETLMAKYEQNSHSDSHLEASFQCKNIFNFCQELVKQHSELTANNTTICNTRHPPLSPYRARSPSPFTSALDTPPSSPLTPIGVLHNLPSFLLKPIFHWLYTESLMVNMPEDVCEKLINFLETQPSLTKMIDPTKTYLNLIRLKKFVVNIIRESHDIFNRMLQSINSSSISHEPYALYSTYKNCFRECAVVCTKIIQICNIFIKKRTKTSRYQKNEIIKYIRTRIPVFLTQIHKLLQNTLEIFTSLSEHDKENLVNYLLPEIELILSLLSNIGTEIKKSFERICKDLKSSHIKLSMKEDIQVVKNQDSFISISPRKFDKPLEKYSKIMPADNDLKFVMYMYEVRKIREIYDRISSILDIINDKKKAYCEMDYLSKQRTILQNFEYLIMEMPMYILILENIINRLDEKMGWKEFKFCFKLVTSQINGIIVKVLEHKSALSDPIKEINKLVQKKEFMQALVDLGLLEPSNDFENENEVETVNKKDVHMDSNYKNIKLDLTRQLCESPVAGISYLSKNALRLLHSGQLADMEFEVQTFQALSNHLPASPLQHNEHLQPQPPIQAHTFKAHRVIVAARCEWFKKALLSGMRESIKRKIIITDTSPVIFRRLLLYLYGAPIDKSVGAEEICELMLLADRYYIDDLKELCESTLNALVDEESVICLLVIADRYLATALRSTCLSFLSQHAELRKSDMFKQLPKVLQIEVMDLINWYGRVPEPWNDGLKPRNSSRHSFKSPSKSRTRSRKSSPSQG